MPYIFLTDEARDALRRISRTGELKSESDRLPNGLWKTEVSAEVMLRLQTNGRRGESIPQTIVRICREARLSGIGLHDPILMSVAANNPSLFEFHGREEKVDVTQHNRFHTLDRPWIEAVVGHPITVSADGKPVGLSDGDITALGAAMAIRDSVINNPSLTREQKMNILERVRNQQSDVKAEIAALEAKHDGLVVEENQLRRQQDALMEVGLWLQRPLILSKPDGSALHRLREAGRAGEVSVLFTDDVLPRDMAETLDSLHSFVVEHNWAGVMSQAEVIGDGTGELSLPFTASCFEFVVSGKRVMAVINEDPDGIKPTRMAIVVKLEQLWAVLLTYTVGDDWKAKTLDLPPDLTEPVQPLADLLIDNVRAMGILLETKIVERQVIRIAAKLNRARERRGKLPLFDYHVVSLARRERAAPRLASELDPDRDITRKRWHLVRGHWRQYPNHRTKIPWHSRGDWDVGIVDKHYRL